jgi:hypothetical protein
MVTDTLHTLGTLDTLDILDILDIPATLPTLHIPDLAQLHHLKEPSQHIPHNIPVLTVDTALPEDNQLNLTLPLVAIQPNRLPTGNILPNRFLMDNKQDRRPCLQ